MAMIPPGLELKVWAQMFFDDGSVSQGRRIAPETLDDDRLIESTASDLAGDLNRTEGLILIWGAGCIYCGLLRDGYVLTQHNSNWMVTSSRSSQLESETLESSPD